MPGALRNPSLIFTICLLFAANATIGAAPAQTKSEPSASADKTASPKTESAKAAPDSEDIPDAELEAAAVQLDLSHSSPLIQKLYEATRETKEQAILDSLSQAKQLLADAPTSKPSINMAAPHCIGPSSAPATTPSQRSSSPTSRSPTSSSSEE